MLGIGTFFARQRAARAEAALREAKATRALDILTQGFDAANQGGRMTGWRRPHTSANSETQPALPFLRAAGRDLVRNSPHANRAVRVLASHIVGTGVRPRAAVETMEEAAGTVVARVTQDQWSRFVENCDPSGQIDFFGQQRLMMRATVESGEALRVWFPVNDGGRLFWRCTVLEPDQLDHQKNEVLKSGGRIVQGVEFDRRGYRVAYHIFDHHPGDMFGWRGVQINSRRVSAEYVDHMFEVLRPGQVRGVSWFAPVATTLRDVDDLAEAEVVRKKLEACIGMVVHSSADITESPVFNGAKDDSGAVLKDAGNNILERMQPGMIVNAPPGWEVSFNAPPASVGLVDHMKERLHAIAAGVGVTYMQMTGDTSTANYSSMREGRIEFHRLVDTWQADLMVQQTGRPAWRRVMQAAQINGELTSGVLPRSRWIAPKRPWVDPSKDVKAAIAAIAAGLEDPATVIEGTGKTTEEVLDGLYRFAKDVRDKKLTLSPSLMAASDQKDTDGDET